MTEFTDHQLRQLIENAHEHRWARTLRVLANELLQVRRQCYLLTGNETNTAKEENARLRTLVRSAYHEGWVDGALNGWIDASNLDTSDADWARSETRNALATEEEMTKTLDATDEKT